MGRHRLATTAGVVGVAVIVLATAAWAKTPPFVIEVPSRYPTVGEPFLVTLRFQPFASDEEDVYLPDQLGGLVSAFPGEKLIRSDEIQITFRRVSDLVYRGEVVFPTVGPWRLWSFPGVSDRQVIAAVYPDFIEVEVDAAGLPAGSTVTPIAFGLIVTLALIAALGFFTRRKVRTRA